MLDDLSLLEAKMAFRGRLVDASGLEQRLLGVERNGAALRPPPGGALPPQRARSTGGGRKPEHQPPPPFSGAQAGGLSRRTRAGPRDRVNREVGLREVALVDLNGHLCHQLPPRLKELLAQVTTPEGTVPDHGLDLSHRRLLTRFHQGECPLRIAGVRGQDRHRGEQL